MVPFLVLVSGSQGGFFDSSRGLRQRDPLSLTLVCYCYALSQMFERARFSNFILGFLVGRSA